MILDAYYKLSKIPGGKSKHRLDVTQSTKDYQPFEALKNAKGDLFFYYGDVPDNFKGNVKRKADKALTKGNNISSVFVPDITLPYGFGDVRGTADAILLIFNPDYTQIEVLIAKGQRNNRGALYNLLTDGELEKEVSILRDKAKGLIVTCLE